MPQLKVIWPKDGPKGHGHRGFRGGLKDILGGKGPDMFVQKKNDTRAILPDEWGNWDSYHDFSMHAIEQNAPRKCKSRGYQRYDPHTRKYVEWATPEDWYGIGVRPGASFDHGGNYPRFTTAELQKIRAKLRRGRPIDPSKMGSDWNHQGPKRFRQEHDWFWQNAHRVGENYREGFSPHDGINPHLRMHQEYPDDLDNWIWNAL